MNVLSLFDGMSCGQLALQRAGIQVENYFAAEIDKYAIKVTQANFPDTVQLGDVQSLHTEDEGLHTSYPEDDPRAYEIDLLIGGSPCQGFSFAGKQLNFDDPRSKLFWEYVRLLKELKPTYFLLENVKMKKESMDVITEALGVEPIFINSSLVSAQNRQRYYWTNIPMESMPDDKGIVLSDILEDGFTDRDKSFCIDANYFKGGNLKSYFEKHRRQLVFSEVKGARVVNRRLDERGKRQDYNKDIPLQARLELRSDDKTNCITTVQKDSVVAYQDQGMTWRKLTPLECERLQTVPEGYTAHVSNTQRYRMLGNGWTVDVVSHIMKGLT